MVLDFLVSSWSFKYDLVFELVFAIVSLILAAFAFKLYNITAENRSKLFGISFLLISISYFVQLIFNFLIISKIDQQICDMASLSSVNVIGYFGSYIHFLFMLAGFAVLLYMTFSIKHPEVLLFLLILSVVSLVMSSNEFSAFYLMSTLFLSFITWHFIKNYFRKKQKLSLLVALAFSLFLFGSFHFFLSVNHQLFFIIGYFLEFVAYILLSINLYLVQKK